MFVATCNMEVFVESVGNESYEAVVKRYRTELSDISPNTK